jgi:uncharacterized protein (TIGR03435 family)
MRTDPRELLAIGVLGSRSRIGIRIEMLLRNVHALPARTSTFRVIASAAVLAAMGISGSIAPHWIAFAQQKDRPSFEVASVKTNDSGPGFSSIRPLAGGRFSATNVDLRTLIALAFRIRTFDIKGGPEWLGSSRFDVEGKAEGSVAGTEIALMLQRLLAQRFHLALHRENRELARYVIAIARGGPKLAKAEDGSCTPVEPGARELPKVPCGSFHLSPGQGGLRRLDAGSISMPDLATALEQLLRQPVVDGTGILETFNIHLEWMPDADTPGTALPAASGASAATSASGTTIFTALREQLGIQLRSEKSPVPILVIDHVEKPDAN